MFKKILFAIPLVTSYYASADCCTTVKTTDSVTACGLRCTVKTTYSCPTMCCPTEPCVACCDPKPCPSC